MSSYLVRALVALALAAFLWAQLRAVAGRPQRRRAVGLGTAALVAFAALNGGLALGLGYGVLQIAIGIAGTALFAGAIIALVASFRAGEAGDQREQIAAAAREYRDRREQERKRR
jgi:hypothetical protein